jgi:1,2-beta-oligoglucan phosphorylase
VPLEGGWRVYSSGAGIALSLVIRHFLGLRLEHDAMVIDPVMPPAMDGLEVTLELGGRTLMLRYQVGPAGAGVRGVCVDGRPLAFTRRHHAYRLGAAAIDHRAWESVVRAGGTIQVVLG